MEINKKMLEELKTLSTMPDEEIDYSDIAEVTDLVGWGANPLFKPLKAPISAKLDRDVIVWLKIHGSVSSFLNRLCREKMYEEHQRLAHAL